MNTPEERDELERKPVIPSQHGAEELEESDLDLDDDDEDLTEEEAERADGA